MGALMYHLIMHLALQFTAYFT